MEICRWCQVRGLRVLEGKLAPPFCPQHAPLTSAQSDDSQKRMVEYAGGADAAVPYRTSIYLASATLVESTIVW